MKRRRGYGSWRRRGIVSRRVVWAFCMVSLSLWLGMGPALAQDWLWERVEQTLREETKGRWTPEERDRYAKDLREIIERTFPEPLSGEEEEWLVRSFKYHFQFTVPPGWFSEARYQYSLLLLEWGMRALAQQGILSAREREKILSQTEHLQLFAERELIEKLGEEHASLIAEATREFKEEMVIVMYSLGPPLIPLIPTRAMYGLGPTFRRPWSEEEILELEKSFLENLPLVEERFKEALESAEQQRAFFEDFKKEIPEEMKRWEWENLTLRLSLRYAFSPIYERLTMSYPWDVPPPEGYLELRETLEAELKAKAARMDTELEAKLARMDAEMEAKMDRIEAELEAKAAPVEKQPPGRKVAWGAAIAIAILAIITLVLFKLRKRVKS